jgi:hypothetical protein
MSQAGIASITRSNPSIPTQFTTDSGIAIPVSNNLNVFGGAGATTSGSGDTITITIVSSGFTWNVVNSAMNPVSLVLENGYIAKGSGIVQFVLPAAASVGDTFFILGYGNLWTLTQNAMQQIFLGSSSTTAGVGGSISATQIKDTVEIVCVTANTEFQIVDSVGNLLIV